MYKFSDKMWFVGDEEYIKSLKSLPHKLRIWCVCPFCEKERFLNAKSVFRRHSTACKGCVLSDNSFNAIAGKKFGRLTVISRIKEKIRYKKQRVLCQCDCGETVVVDITAVSSGNTKSCGCLSIEKKKARCGPLSSRYNQNMSDEQRALIEEQRNNSKYKSWRKEVLKRDENACTICDATDNLVVHHLNGFKDNENLRLDVDNGVTLCWSCHHSFHQNFMGGYKVPCTLQNFEDFLYQI